MSASSSPSARADCQFNVYGPVWTLAYAPVVHKQLEQATIGNSFGERVSHFPIIHGLWHTILRSTDLMLF